MSLLRDLEVNYLVSEIITVSRTDWSKTSTFTDKNVLGSVTALALSSNGVYLASASQSRVHVWATQTRRVIAK
jgi:chromosome transmission fidelity protein 4